MHDCGEGMIGRFMKGRKAPAGTKEPGVGAPEKTTIK